MKTVFSLQTLGTEGRREPASRLSVKVKGDITAITMFFHFMALRLEVMTFIMNYHKFVKILIESSSFSSQIRIRRICVLRKSDHRGCVGRGVWVQERKTSLKLMLMMEVAGTRSSKTSVLSMTCKCRDCSVTNPKPISFGSAFRFGLSAACCSSRGMANGYAPRGDKWFSHHSMGFMQHKLRQKDPKVHKIFTTMERWKLLLLLVAS